MRPTRTDREPDPGHGVFDLIDALTAIDGRTFHVGMAGGMEQAEFDRAVRESMDRQHRRRMIAER